MEHIQIPVVREDLDTNVVIHFHFLSGKNEVTLASSTLDLAVNYIIIQGVGGYLHWFPFDKIIKFNS